MATPATPGASEQRVDGVRGFNRFYTRQIGVLNEHLLDSPFSLTEMRVLYELAHRSSPTAASLGNDLGLDPGYLSRMLRSFEKQGLIRRVPAPLDGRQSLLSLTGKGQRIFTPYEKRSQEQVATLLAKLSPDQQVRLLEAMHSVETLLDPARAPRSAVFLRPHRPGDMGWVVQRHGELYWREYHYDERFEALVAEICAEFIENLDSARERCWIAEKDGVNVGSVFLVKKSASVAKLRLLLVEPSARGLGIGKRLVEECVRFARDAGYKKILLWTQSELQAARSIYQKAGFEKVGEEKHQSWSRTDLIAETWELKLR
ncbi:MAG TPA: helix-turn-helix domain-containing GNAT family N-acetyltransferase [Candidatus Sulfotelmatobacter sp.]|nr:helix-turn-helix domain-containing GNAT family N-acetyltransferase [Candidatus Sulfotelmatobacter sp.]